MKELGVVNWKGFYNRNTTCMLAGCLYCDVTTGQCANHASNHHNVLLPLMLVWGHLNNSKNDVIEDITKKEAENQAGEVRT